MAEITAAAVKALREKTGLPMMECKKALVEADGVEDTAISNLRAAGRKTQATRADRATSEGKIAIHLGDGVGTMIELQCESGPVASNEDFVQLCKDLAQQLATGPGAATPDELLTQPSPSIAAQTLGEQKDELVGLVASERRKREEQQEKTDAAIAELRGLIADRTVAASSVSSIAPPGMPNAGQGRARGWQPSCVKITWEKYDNRRVGALDRADVIEIIEGIVAQCSADCRNIIDLHASKEHRNKKILLWQFNLVVRHGRDACQMVRAELERLAKSGQFRISGKTPTIKLETEPSRRPMLRAGAVCMQQLETFGIPSRCFREPEWGPFQLFVGETLAQNKCKPPVLLVTWSESAGYVVNSDALNMVSNNVTVDQLVNACNQTLSN